MSTVKKLPTTWEGFCKLAKRDPKMLPDVSKLPEHERAPTISEYKLAVITDIINKGWVPDYINYSEWKYEPVFRWDASLSAFRFWTSHYDLTAANTLSGARHVFKSQADMKHIVEHFIDDFNNVLQKKQLPVAKGIAKKEKNVPAKKAVPKKKKK